MPVDRLDPDAICQIAIIVRDIDAASRRFAELFGVPVPEAHLTDTADKSHIRYRGQPTEARAKLAFFKTGSLSLELIEPVGGPSTWKEFLDEHGEGVHHIAFRVKGMDDVLMFLNGQGMPTAQRGDYTGGCYAYVDAMKPLGVNIELLENFARG